MIFEAAEVTAVPSAQSAKEPAKRVFLVSHNYPTSLEHI